MANKIQLRRDIKSNWEAGTKILVDGEMGIEFPNDFDAMDPHAGEYPPRFKIGPGNWNELPYSSLGIDWDGNLEVPNNLVIGGNFTVTGDTTYVNATNTVLTDNLLELHAPDGGVGGVWTVNDTKDIGLRMHYYNGADKNAALIMDNGTWRLKWIVDGTEVGGQFNHTGLGDIEASTFYGALSGNATTATTASVATTVTLVATNSTNSSHYLTFVDSATGNDNVRTDTSLTYNPSSNTLTAVTFSGALSGTATNATNIAISTNNGNPSGGESPTPDTTMYPVLVGSSSTGNQLPHIDYQGLSYNASTNALTASTFVGDLTGTATLATDVAGGTANYVLYQTSSNNTGFISPSTSGYVLTSNGTGSAPSFKAITAPTIDANNLTGTTLASNVVNSSLTSVGTLSSLTVSGTANMNGLTQVQQLHIPYIAKSNATSTVTHDCSAGQIFYHTTPSANFTANFTNLNLANGYTTEIKLIIVQGSSARIPNAVQIGGVTKTIGWLGNATPSGTANRTEIVTFKVLLSGTNYSVFGKLESYGNSSNVVGGGGGGG